MTAQTTNLLLRNDTIFGVCEALGQDFGINPTWLRVAFCLPVFWNPLLVIGAYCALGVLVAALRFTLPDRKVAIVEGSKPATVAAEASEIVDERELVAA